MSGWEGTRKGTELVQAGSHAECLGIQPEPALICFHEELSCCHGKQKGSTFSINPAQASRHWLGGTYAVDSVVLPGVEWNGGYVMLVAAAKALEWRAWAASVYPTPKALFTHFVGESRRPTFLSTYL